MSWLFSQALVEAFSEATCSDGELSALSSGNPTPQAYLSPDGKPLSEQIGGSLNPTWVEWLMGWPLGWTDLKPLATGKCQPAPQPRGEFLQEVEA
jgi:hypothetical protein